MMTIAVHMIAVGYFARHSEAYAVAESGVSAVSKKLQHIANTRTDTHKAGTWRDDAISGALSAIADILELTG